MKCDSVALDLDGGANSLWRCEIPDQEYPATFPFIRNSLNSVSIWFVDQRYVCGRPEITWLHIFLSAGQTGTLLCSHHQQHIMGQTCNHIPTLPLKYIVCICNLNNFDHLAGHALKVTLEHDNSLCIITSKYHYILYNHTMM